MTGPTFKFWTWTEADWPYGAFIALCGLVVIASLVSIGFSVAELVMQ